MSETYFDKGLILIYTYLNTITIILVGIRLDYHQVFSSEYVELTANHSNRSHPGINDTESFLKYVFRNEINDSI